MAEFPPPEPVLAPESLPCEMEGLPESVTDGSTSATTLDALHHVTRELVGTESPSRVCALAVAAARDVLDLPFSGIHVEDGESLVPVAVTEGVREQYGEVPPIEDPVNPASQAYRDEEPVHLGEYDDRRSVEVAKVPSEGGLLAPLDGHGVFLMTTREERRLDQDEISFALTLAANTRVALDEARRERQLQRQNERLETLAAVLSHDLRNPLTMLDGRLELAREQEDLSHLEGAAEAVQRMEDLIEDVLVLARYGEEPEDLEWIDPTQTIWAAWAECPDRGELSVEVPTELLLEANPDRLRQLLANCLRNSVEHGGDQPSITVGLEDDVLYVADDGPGIPPEERSQVFDYGYSNADGGTGLGLKIVHDLAAAHGWTASVAESETGGARIELAGVQTRERRS